MPELPEVDLVVQDLNRKIQQIKKQTHSHAQLTSFKTWRKDIRYPLPTSELKKIISCEKSEIKTIRRRAKYIIFELSDSILISHLGMTGHWSFYEGDLNDYDVQKHDHVGLQLNHRYWFIYNDPRRFGFLIERLRIAESEYFSGIGYEPLEMNDQNIDDLWSVSQKLQSNIKSFMMNQKYIVGVGNIYASEVLFKLRIDPFKSVRRVKKETFRHLVFEIKKILSEAILAGGSSIRSYKKVDFTEGNFQEKHLVYDREGEPCSVCKKPIQRELIAGRSTFYCSACQR